MRVTLQIECCVSRASEYGGMMAIGLSIRRCAFKRVNGMEGLRKRVRAVRAASAGLRCVSAFNSSSATKNRGCPSTLTRRRYRFRARWKVVEQRRRPLSAWTPLFAKPLLCFDTPTANENWEYYFLVGQHQIAELRNFGGDTEEGDD